MTRRVVVTLMVGAIALGACAAPRQTLGTRNSPCFRSIPTAKAAVHHNGRLEGVRLVKRDTLLRDLPEAQLPPGKEFCLVAFSDDYRSDNVDHAVGAASAKYAVVVVNMRGTEVIQTFLVDRLPLRLRHR